MADRISAGETRETKNERMKRMGSRATVAEDSDVETSNHLDGTDGDDANELSSTSSKKVDLKAVITCTACHHKINIHKPGSVNQHPILKVLLCKSCYKWYTSGKIDQGSDGMDEQCRWCGEGGKLVLCDFCHNAFCKDCIRHNLGRKELASITEDNSKWHCYVCKPLPLKGLATYCTELREALKDLGTQNSADQISDTDTDSMSLDRRQKNTVCFTGKNIEHITDDLFTNASSWVKKLGTLRSSLKRLNARGSSTSSSVFRQKDDMAKQIYKHFLTLDSLVVSVKDNVGKKGSGISEKRKGKSTERKKENGIQALDVDLSGSDVEDSDLKAASDVEIVGENDAGHLPKKKTLNSEDIVELPDEDDNGEEEEEDDEKQPEIKNSESVDALSPEKRSAEGDKSGSPGNPKIRLTISLPKLNQADLEAQRQLHYEGMKISKRKSKEEEEEEEEEEEAEKKEEDDESSTTTPAEESESESSSAEEYNPKLDLREMKSERRQERRNRAKRIKSRAAKRSLQKIREAVQKKKLKKEEEKEEEDEEEDEKEEKETETKKSKSSSKKDKKNQEDSGQRKSARLKQVDKKSKEEEEQTTETEQSTKGRKSRKTKKDEEEKMEVDGENKDEKKKKRSDGKKNKSQKENDEGGDAEDEEGVKKQSKSGKKNKNKSKEDGETDGKTSDIDDEIRRLEKMPQLKESKASTKSKKTKEENDDKDDDDEEKNEKVKDKRKKKGKLVDELSSDEEDYEQENKNEEEEDEEEELTEGGKGAKSQEDAATIEDDSNDARARKALVDESDEDVSSGNDTEAADDDEDDEETKDEETRKKEKKRSDDDSDSEADNKVTKKQRPLKLQNIALSSSEDEKKKKTRKKKSHDSDLEEDFVPKKRRGKRKRRGSSPRSDQTDSDDFVESKKYEKKKKRRRIKANSSSENEEANEDGSDNDDDDFQSPQGKKRKKIHKILKDTKLSKETLDAAKAEEDRRHRIDERQKLFNQVTVEDAESPTKCPVTTKLQLEVDEETKEPIIDVHKKLICKLKPHQVEAVKFMWSCCIESLERMKEEEGSGCILAHCMGLGKTLSVITFVHTLLRHKKLTKMRTCLVLCPLNTILNWESEFERWLADSSPLDVYELSTVKDNWGRSEVIKDWQEGGGILIMGYEMFRTLSQLSRVKNKKQKKTITEGLLDPGPDIVVCDEGHILKNDATGLSKACNQIKTRRRVVLTGTPLQNNLVEYHCMVTFVKPSLLGTRKEFMNRFVNPITNGQCSDSTPHDVKIMKRRAHILHETLAGCVQRKDYSALTKYLLPKHEYVVLIRLSPVQIELYEKYLERLGQDIASQTVRGSRIFTDYQNLMKIWTHPWVLKLDEIRQETRKVYKDDYDSFIDDSDCESEMSFNSKSSKSVEEVGSGSEDEWKPKRVTRGAAKKQKEESAASKDKTDKASLSNGAAEDKDGDSDKEEVVKGWKTKSRGGGGTAVNETPAVEIIDESSNSRVSSEWWADFIKPSDQYSLEISGKLMLLAEILKMAESIGDKVLVFSQSLLSLDLIENFLAHWDMLVATDPEKQVAGTQGWDRGVDYIRMDGSTSAQNRKDWTAMFNDEDNVKARLFLISTKAGSLGINLVAANRVIIFDASWNPTHDVQSIFRVYRFGQTKPVYVYRFLAQGTMEEKIYERQVTKQSLAQRVIDEHQIERHFTAADLRELYVFKPDKLDDPNRTEKPTPKLPKDRMLAELLTNHKDLIVQYHEHDSLLENKVEEELSEEERKAAWEEYEQEKKGLRPPPSSFQYNMAAANLMQNMASIYNQPSSYQISNYIPDAHKIAQAIFASNPGISEGELKQRVQYFLQMQLANQQRAYLAQQQKQEMEKLQRMQEDRIRQQMLLQQLGYGSSRSDASVTIPDANILTNLMAQSGSTRASASKSKGSSNTSTAPSTSQ